MAGSISGLGTQGCAVAFEPVKHSPNSSRPHTCAAICALVSLLATLIYVRLFEKMLLNGDIYGTGSIASPFVPDTLVYLDLASVDDWDIFTFAIAGVKNAIAPALLWGAAGGDWYWMAAINALVLFIGLIYLAKLCQHFKVSKNRASAAILLVGFLPAIWFFSIGSLKELPTMTALTGFLYHYLKRQSVSCLLMGILLVSMRYQLVGILPLFVIIASYSKRPLRTAVICLVIVSAMFPLFTSLGVLSLDASADFREAAGTESSLGASMEAVRDEVPILSVAVIAARVVLSVLEPLMIFVAGPYLLDDGRVSIQAFAYLSTLLLTLPAWYRTARSIVRGWRAALPLDLQSLYALILLYGVPVGGFSFIHGRYMFPLTGLVVLGAIFQVRVHAKPGVRVGMRAPPSMTSYHLR